MRAGALFLIVLIVLLSACGNAVSAPSHRVAAVATPVEGPTIEPSSIDEDIGAITVFSWRGAVPWETVRPILADNRIGGVLLFTSNFGGDPVSLRDLSDRVHALGASTCLEHPVLVMLDEEGGAVSNVKASFSPPWPREMALSGAGKVREWERANGGGLHAAGVGLNLAPVADVRTNPRDAIIQDRSFGSSPAVVAPLVGAAVQGLHEGGVGTVVKHFPGLGGAPGDPHVAIPTDPESEASWLRVQVPGFQAGIAAGADAVMTTAVYVPGLGAGNTPALFSSAVVGRLRSQFGFGGVIMTDSLSMWGIGQKWSLGESAVMALAAGNDMLLLGNGDPSLEASAVAAVRAAVQSGRLDRAKIHESAVRVNALRDRWGPRVIPCRPPLTA